MAKQYLVPMFAVVNAQNLADAEAAGLALQKLAQQSGLTLCQDQLIPTHAAGSTEDGTQFRSILDVVPVSELGECLKGQSQQPEELIPATLSPIKMVVIQPGIGRAAFALESTFAGANRVLQEISMATNTGGTETQVEVRLQWHNGMHHTTKIEIPPGNGGKTPNLERALSHAIAVYLGRVPHPGLTKSQHLDLLDNLAATGVIQQLRQIEANCRLGDI